MLNIPLLKFEKTTTYLNNQLSIQENNKQLIMDIIANIGLILNTSSDDKKENFEKLLNSSNEFLQTILNNITTIEVFKMYEITWKIIMKVILQQIRTELVDGLIYISGNMH